MSLEFVLQLWQIQRDQGCCVIWLFFHLDIQTQKLDI